MFIFNLLDIKLDDILSSRQLFLSQKIKRINKFNDLNSNENNKLILNIYSKKTINKYVPYVNYNNNIIYYNINLDNLLNDSKENNYLSNVIIQIQKNTNNKLCINNILNLNYDNVFYKKQFKICDLVK